MLSERHRAAQDVVALQGRCTPLRGTERWEPPPVMLLASSELRRAHGQTGTMANERDLEF